MNRRVMLPILFMTALFVLSCYTSKKKSTMTYLQKMCTKDTTSSCWLKIKNKKQCYTYSAQPLSEEAVTWSGVCEKEKPEGNGKLIWYVKGAEYSVYNGKMHLGVREGNGIYKTKRYQYKGEHKNDLSDGYGELITNTHEIYKGYWTKGRMNGKGKLILSDGVSLVGEWDAGHLNGQATVRDPKAQSTYTGEMKNSKKNGKGKLLFDNGVVWLTTYKNNKLDGEVIIIKKDGARIETVWKDGKLISPKTR